MAKFNFGYSFVSYTPVADSQDTNYLIANLYNYGFRKRHWRSLVSTEVTIVVNFAVAKAILGVMLDDVNFVNVFIAGNATDSWGSPSFAEVEFAISKDERNQRYKAYAALTGFNYQYMRLRIPAQTPVDGLSVFKMGTLVCLDNVLNLTQNPAWPYEYSADEKIKINEFESGGDERVNLGDLLWEGSFKFGSPYKKDNEGDIWTINNIKKDENIVFFENDGDTSKVYLCRRSNTIKVSWLRKSVVKTDSITLKEVS